MFSLKLGHNGTHRCTPAVRGAVEEIAGKGTWTSRDIWLSRRDEGTHTLIYLSVPVLILHGVLS